MVTRVTQIPEPPVPDDPPAEFHQKASDAFAGLYRAIPQMNLQADEIEQIGADAQTAKERAIQESDAALGYRNEARAARDTALAASATAAEQAGQAVVAKDLSEDAAKAAGKSAVEANHILAEASRAIAMADVYTAVPTTFKAWQILVVQPHLRNMVWNVAQGKYVRAPWHQPCEVFFTHDNPSSLSYALPVRGDVVWQQSQFPDIVARLGLSGIGTFTLVEARGEFIRVLDNGRGIDAGRAQHSLQLDAMQRIQGSIFSGNPPFRDASYTGAFKKRPGSDGGRYGGDFPGGSDVAFDSAGDTSLRIAAENRSRNIPFPLWMTF